MAIVIRDDVANETPYNQIIERLRREGRKMEVYRCPEDGCNEKWCMFYEDPENLSALEHHALFFLAGTHPNHDAVCTFNEELPAEVEDLSTGQ